MSIVFDEKIRVVALSLSIALLLTRAAWQEGYYRFPLAQQKKSLPLSYVIWAFGLFLISEVLIAPMVCFLGFFLYRGVIINSQPFEEKSFFLNAVNLSASSIAIISLGVFFRFVPSKVCLDIWGDRAFSSWLRRFYDWLLGVFSWILCYPWILFVGQTMEIAQEAFYSGPHVEQLAVRYLRESLQCPTLLLLVILAICFIVPILEEVLFRGILQTWLASILSQRVAIGLTSFAFALFHFSFSQKWDNLQLLFSLFVLSCYLGYLFERQRSLFAPIGLHMSFNAISTYFIFKS